MAKKRVKPVYRSAVSGRFVSKGYLKGHPTKTVTEHVKKGKKK
ncbi:MAG: hypothetical protein V1907_00170 [Candidatus Kerfeldbacteria bacterium]